MTLLHQASQASQANLSQSFYTHDLSLQIVIIADSFFLIVDHDTWLIAPVMLEVLPLLLEQWRVVIVEFRFEHGTDTVNL